MDIQTATPAEIDTKLAEILTRAAKAEAQAAMLIKSIERMTAQEWNAHRIPKLQAELDSVTAAADAAHAEAAPLNAEFAARGGWTRYYMVQNGNGHVHPNTDVTCSRTRETSHYWLTEQSGMSAAELVELAGETACTNCFPDAPVNVLNRPTRLEAPERKAARIEREAAAAARAAKKAKNAIPETAIYTQGGRRPEKLVTLTAARSRLTDQYQYVEVFGWDEFITGGLDDLVSAIAAKEDKTAEQVIAEARTRAAKRK